MNQTEVFIAGAGPSGLLLALWLTRAGVKVRIVDKAARAGTTSRALVMHARNLELYHQLGLDGLAVERGIEFRAANLWVGGRKAGRVPFSKIGSQVSPYPFMLIFPQDQHERLLLEQLEALGVQVERSTEVVSLHPDGGGVEIGLRMADGNTETCSARYLAGCDGAHSTVRHLLGIEFSGGTYENTYYVADLNVKGPVADGDMHVALDDADFMAVFPMKGEGNIRVVGSVGNVPEAPGGLTWEGVDHDIMQRLGMAVQEVRWFSTYRVHHRVAAAFRKGPVFLLGDAGHVHSPVGGQGMNTGLGDAINLAWKLAACLQQGAPDALLDTYSEERIRFARTLVRTTDRAFRFVSRRSRLATRVRTRLLPRLLPLLFHFRSVRRFLFLVVSQIRIEYRNSALSQGLTGRRQAGDRLPWVPGEQDNFAPLTSRKWQVHGYGLLPAGAATWLKEKGIDCHVFPWTREAARAGLKQGALYLIRPDGYIGLVERRGDLAAVARYIERWQVTS